MPRGKKGSGEEKKGFPDLDQDEQDKIVHMSREELRDYIAKVAMDNANLMIQRAEDQHLKECKQATKDADENYREGNKRNGQRIKLSMRCLGDKGGDTQPVGEATASTAIAAEMIHDLAENGYTVKVSVS